MNLCECGCGKLTKSRTALGHHMRVYVKRTARPLADRFHERYEIQEDGCWRWTAHLDHGGYGKINHYYRTLAAHRLSYELHKGPIPDGLHLDHLCCNTACVNPDHLEPVTHRENVRRAIERKKQKHEPYEKGEKE